MQIQGDNEFNSWAREASLSAAEKDTPIVYVAIKRIKASTLTHRKLELVA